MKFILIFLVSINIFATKIKFEYNENVNLIRFMFTISNYGEGSILLKSMYKRKYGEKDKEKIKEFKDLVNSIPRNIDLYPWKKKLPENYIRWKRRTEILTYFASASKNLNDFKSSLYSIYPNKKAYKLSELIDYFLPIYRNTYYNKKSKREIKKLIKYLKRIDKKTQSFFKMEKFFYDSKINIPEVKIFIYPLYINPKDKEYFKKKHLYITRSNSLKTLQVVEVVLPFKKNTSWYGVVLHELAHFCYDSSEMIPIFLAKMKSYEGKYGYFASKYLNEALATAIGNGYISNKINKSKKPKKKCHHKTPKKGIMHSIYSATINSSKLCNNSENLNMALERWYNDPIIDLYAHTIYPLVKETLENKKTLDIKQSKKFVEIFKENFPNILTRKEIIFNPINVITSKSFNYREVINTLRRYVTINDSSASSPIDNKITIDFYNKDNKTQVFIMKKSELQELKKYKNINLKQLKEDCKSKIPFVRITKNKEKDRLELFFIVKDSNDYKKLIKKVMKSDKIVENIIYLKA